MAGVGLVLSLALHGGSRSAHAHPFGNRFAAQQLEVDLTADAVAITLTADVPDALIDDVARGATPPIPAVLARMTHAVTLTIDGDDVPLELVDADARRNLVDDEGELLTVRWRAAHDLVGRHRIRVGNGTFSDVPAWFRDEVRLPAGAALHATNLRPDRGDWRHDRWLRSERLRRIDLDLELPGGPWAALFRARAAPRAPDEVWRGDGRSAWRAGHDTPTTVATAAGFGAALGASAGAATGSRPRALALLASVVWLGLVLLGAPFPAGAAGPWGVALAACGLGVHLGGPWHRIVPFVGLAAVTSLTEPLWWPITLGAWAVGTLAARVLPAHVAGAALALTALVVVTRG